RVARDHVGLAEGARRRRLLGVRDVGAAEDQAWVEREAGLDHLLAERVEDARRLVDRAVTGLRREHAHRMRRLALHAQHPTARGAACDAGGVHAAVLAAALER